MLGVIRAQKGTEMFVQVIKVDEPREGKTKEGREWKMQEVQCILLDEGRTPVEVAVMDVPRDMIGKVSTGVFLPVLRLQANKGRDGGRKLEARIVGLNPADLKHPGGPK